MIVFLLMNLLLHLCIFLVYEFSGVFWFVHVFCAFRPKGRKSHYEQVCPNLLTGSFKFLIWCTDLSRCSQDYFKHNLNLNPAHPKAVEYNGADGDFVSN